MMIVIIVIIIGGGYRRDSTDWVGRRGGYIVGFGLWSFHECRSVRFGIRRNSRGCDTLWFSSLSTFCWVAV